MNLAPTCSQASLLADEQLFGTAPLISDWLLVEARAPLQAQALRDNPLPQEVRLHLDHLQQSMPGLRVLLIRRPGRRETFPLRAYFAHALEEPRLHTFELPDYQALLELDLPALAAGGQAALVAQPPAPARELFLVCTNGKRDPCCASHGEPAYQRLIKLAPDHAWQCSHLGGHRFAANLVYLPYGIYFGRVQPGEVPELVAACRQGRLLAERYRGRACYPPAAQAAEYYLQRSQPGLGFKNYRLQTALEEPGGRWQVGFDELSGRRHRVHLRAAPSAFQIFESCGAEDKRSRKTQYLLEALDLDESAQ